MRVVHVAAHLGGGIGRAHSAMAPHMPRGIEQVFVLLDQPRDRFADEIVAYGGRIIVSQSPALVARDLAPDILQFEWWDHPALRWFSVPGVPTVTVAHKSGRGGSPLPDDPAIDHLVLTSSISLVSAPGREVSVINSGFGFDADWQDRSTGVAYLGTVDFKKMHPKFFSAVDKLETLPAPIDVWGRVGDIANDVCSMVHPELVRLRGYTDDPRGALESAGIFFYPLRPDHYGTGENALVEAMSLGLVPVVLSNSAEMAIVDHRETGIVCDSIDECAYRVRELIRYPEVRRHLSQGAHQAARLHSPVASAEAFFNLWDKLIEKSKRRAA